MSVQIPTADPAALFLVFLLQFFTQYLSIILYWHKIKQSQIDEPRKNEILVEENCGRELFFKVGDCFLWFWLCGIVCVYSMFHRIRADIYKWNVRLKKYYLKNVRKNKNNFLKFFMKWISVKTVYVCWKRVYIYIKNIKFILIKFVPNNIGDSTKVKKSLIHFNNLFNWLHIIMVKILTD